MTPAQAARLLALPPTVRATLAGVPGPGWRIGRTGHTILQPSTDPHELLDGYAWWPASPAAAVAAVLGCTEREAYRAIYVRLVSTDSHDGADAALSIIEAHARHAS